MEIKKLLTLLENKLGDNKLLLLLTFYNESKGTLINRIQFNSIDTGKGYFNIASNGNNVCRVFFRNNKFSVDALWNVAKYTAPYFSMKRVKAQDGVEVLPKHLLFLRKLFISIDRMDSIAETVAAINIAVNNFPKFAAYAISQKKIYLKKIYDIPTRKNVAQYVGKVTGDEELFIPDYLKDFKFNIEDLQIKNDYAVSTVNPVIVENTEDKKIIEINNMSKTSSMRSIVMKTAHEIRRRKLKDPEYAALKFNKQMSVALTESWKQFHNKITDIHKEAAITIDEHKNKENNNIVITKEEKNEPVETNNKDEYIIDFFRNPRFKENNRLSACNTLQCRKNKNCLYLVTYKFGFAVEDYQGNIFQCLPTKKVDRIRLNNCLLTDPRSFKKIFNKLFGENPIMIKEHLHESVSIPKIRFEGKVYTLIVFGYDNLDTFSPDIAENVMNAKEDK